MSKRTSRATRPSYPFVAQGQHWRRPSARGTIQLVIELVAGESRAVVVPEWGGRLHQLFANGEPLLVAPASFDEYTRDPHGGGCFPMAPWAGRIRNGRFTWEEIGRAHV